MANKYLLGLDNGGSVTKAGLYDVEGNEIAVASALAQPIMERVGFVERDMDVLWHANVKAIREVIEKSGVDPKEILGVAATGHGNGAYFIDEDGRPVGNGIISTDTRAKDIVEKWNKDGVYDRILPKTMQIIWAGQPVSIIAWYKENKRDLIDKIRWVLSCKDYIRFCLTDEAYAEITDMSASSAFNIKDVGYDDEILTEFDILDYKHIFPPIKRCDEICGRITKKAAAETGLIEGTPVAGGLYDVTACCIGTGVTTEEKMCIVAGTWSINEFISKKPIASKELFQTSIYCMENYWLPMEGSMTSATNLEWFVQNFMDKEKIEMEKQGKKVYEAANEMASSIEPEDCPIIFLPFLFGTNVNADAKACFMGINSLHKKAHIIRSIYEGVVFSHMTHIESLLKFRDTPNGIRISGGAARSKVWVQIFADVLQIPIEVSAISELGTLGAAMCAGIASEQFENFEQAVDVFSKVAYVCQPNPDKKEIYQKKYGLYKILIKNFDSIWSEWRKL